MNAPLPPLAARQQNHPAVIKTISNEEGQRP